MRGKMIMVALGIGLLMAGPAQTAIGIGTASAEEWGHGGRGYYGGGYGYHNDHDGIGAGGVILGLAAVAGVAALASSAAAHRNNGYYDRGYYAPSSAPAYGYGYGDGDYGRYAGGGDYTRAAIGACANAAVGQAQGWTGYARFGHVDAIDRRGDDAFVRGTVRIGDGGYDRYARGYGAREVRFSCTFDRGLVRGVRVERPDYAYGGY